MTNAVEADIRRMVALTITLVQKGWLPAFYRTPRKQVLQARQFQQGLSALLGSFGTSLLSGLESGTISPANGLQVNGALLADGELVANGLQGRTRMYIPRRLGTPSSDRPGAS